MTIGTPSTPSIRDTVVSQIPGHILESYPRFREFLEAYYEWLHQEGNPYERVKYHMDYLDFQKSIDSYVNMMKTEYLKDVPDAVLLDKELFIKWSKKLHLSRGSHASYKFLFRLLFNEQDTSIYLPKDNILRTSDGIWIEGEFKLFLTNSFNINDLQFQTITQKREIATDVFEYATATIESYKRFYSGRFNLIEVRIRDIEGDFKSTHPIITQNGGIAWMIPTILDFELLDRGYNHQPGELISLDSIGDYVISHEPEEADKYDTRVTTYFTSSDLAVSIDGNLVTDFEYDGRYIYHDDIEVTSNIQVSMPSYKGYIRVGDVDTEGAIASIEMLEPPIGVSEDEYTVTSEGYGSNLSAKANKGLYSKVQGYYKNHKGHLSSDMYLQDSFYYQDYSYAIKTYKDLDSYAEIVKSYLHPAGFEMFGIMNIIFVIEQLLELHSTQEHVITTRLDDRAEYSLGPNYSFIDKTKERLSKRLYRTHHLKGGYNRDYYMDEGYDDGYYVRKPYTFNQGYESDQAVGSDELLDDSMSKTYDSLYNERASGLDLIPFDHRYYEVSKPSWTSKHNFIDYHLYVIQDYSLEVESGIQYFETGYVSPRFNDDETLSDLSDSYDNDERILLDQSINDIWPSQL